MSFETKNHSEEIMRTSKLRNKYLKHKIKEKRVPMLRKTKINYSGILDEKGIIDNKKSWKTVSHSLSDKSIYSNKINLN